MNNLFAWLTPLFQMIAGSPFGQFVTSENLLLLTPEFLLLVSITLGLFQTMAPSQETQRATWDIAFLGTLFAFLSLVNIFVLGHIDPTGHLYTEAVISPVFNDMFRSDLFSVGIRLVLLLGTLLVLLFSRQYVEKNTELPGEFYLLLLGATLGAMLMSGANDLIMLFVALETLGISSFILTGYLRGNLKSAEASLKYLLYGGASSAVLLFGLSLLYGLSGGYTHFQEITFHLSQLELANFTPVVLLMTVLLVGGFAFKLSAAPFHMWTPDIYEGAPTPITAYLSVVSKVGAFALVIRFLTLVLSTTIQTVSPASVSLYFILFSILAVLSMTLGNLAALRQNNIKRLLAYSTIAHVGYVLLGFVIMGQEALASMVFYLITYVFMNLGAFAVVIHISHETGREDVNAYAGLIRKKPWMTLYLTFFLLSLAGIPITAGFFAKFFLFQSVAMTGNGYLWLVIIALLNSTISLYYYLNIIRLMVVAEPSDAVNALSRRVQFLPMLPVASSLIICFLGTLLLGVYAEPLMGISRTAIQQLKATPQANPTQVMSQSLPATE